MKYKSKKHKDANTFKFQPFSERIKSLDVDVFYRIGHKNENEDDDDDKTYLYKSLQKWNVLNLSEGFANFRKDLPFIETLPLLLCEKENVINTILRHLDEPDPLVLQSILEMLIAFVKDLRSEAFPSFELVLKKLTALLVTKDADELEWILSCLAYIFKYLWRYMVKDIKTLFDNVLPLFSEAQPTYINNFVAESFAFVARKVKDKRNFLKVILRTLSSNSNDTTVQGCGRLLFEVVRGLRGQFHSIAPTFLKEAIELLYDASVPQTLMYALLSEMVIGMCAIISYKEFSVFWAASFDAVIKHLPEIDRPKRIGRYFNFILIKQALEFHDCVLLGQVDDIIVYISRILSIAKDQKEVTTASIQIISPILLSNNIHLSQEQAQYVTSQVLNIKYHDQVVNFVKRVVHYAGFDLLILPWVKKYTVSELKLKLNGSCTSNRSLHLLAYIILKKQPTTISGLCLQDWKPYLLDFSKLNAVSETGRSIFEEEFNICCSKEEFDKVEDLISMLIIIPHVKWMPENGILATLELLLSRIMKSISVWKITRLRSNYVQLNVLLHLYCCALEAHIHLGGTLNESHVNVVLNFVQEPQYIAALYSLDLCLTAMRKEERSIQIFQNIYPYLLVNLSSPFQKVRLVSLHSLSLFDALHGQGSYFSICYKAEQIPATINDYREKLLYLNELSFDVIQKNSKDYREAFLTYLLGVLYVNFQLIWEPVMELITSYARGLPRDIFWQVFESHLISAALHAEGCTPKLPVPHVFSESHLVKLSKKIQVLNDEPDYYNYRILLWKTFGMFPEILEKKHRDVAPLFLDFIEKYKKTTDDVTFTNVKQMENGAENDTESEGSDDEQDTTTSFQDDNAEQHGVTDGKENEIQPKKSAHDVQALLAHMNVFAQARKPQAIYQTSKLRSFYYDCLTSQNPELQKKALDCIVAYNDGFFMPYRVPSYGLLDDKRFKTEMTMFSIDKDDAMVQMEHRKELMPIIMRILYGKMLRKTGTFSRGKTNADFRRGIVLRFISGCTEDEMLLFLKICFRMYESFLKDNPENKITDIIKSVDLTRVISLKRLRSAINMILVVMDQLGSSMGINVLKFVLRIILYVGSVVTGILAKRELVHSGFLSSLKSLRSNSQEAMTLFFRKFVDFTWDREFISAVFHAFVWPSLEKLPVECIHNPTPLLRLFIAWSKESRYFVLFTMKMDNRPDVYPLPYIMQLLTYMKCRPSVTNAVLDIVESLLTLQDEETANGLNTCVRDSCVRVDEERLTEISKNLSEKLNFGTSILIPYAQNILIHLKQKLAHRKRGLTRRDLFILSRFCELDIGVETSEALLDLMIPLLQKKAVGGEQTVKYMIETLCSLLRNVRQPTSYIRSMAPLFGTISSIDSRKMLCQILADISVHHDEKQQNSSVVQEINAWDARFIEQPDLGRRIDGFRQIENMVDTDKIVLDYGLLILYNCFHTLKSEKDLGLRDSVSSCMRKLTIMLVKKAAEARDNGAIEIIITLTCSGIRDKYHNTLQYETTMLLGEMARKCGSQHFILRDLQCLCDESDPEVDFFNNIVHLQNYRRSKALLRFCEIFKEVKNRPNPRTLTQVMLPIVSAFLCAEKYIGKSAIIDAAISSMGVICKFLPWHQYEGVLKYFLFKLRTVSGFQKQLVRIVQIILEGFHFDLSQAQIKITPTMAKGGDNSASEATRRNKQSEVKTKSGALSNDTSGKMNEESSPTGHIVELEKTNNKDGENIQEGASARDADEEAPVVSDAGNTQESFVSAGENDEDNSFAIDDDTFVEMLNNSENDTEEVAPLLSVEPAINHQVKLSPSNATRVANVVVNALLPQLHAAIGQYTSTEKVHKGINKKRIEEQSEDDILRIPMAVAVVKLLQQLPSSYIEQYLPGILAKICTFLKSRLDSVRRVTRQTLDKIMCYLGPPYLEILITEMSTSLTKGFQVHVLMYTLHSVLVSVHNLLNPGDIDGCLSKILELCEIDIFGTAAEEKNVGKITGKTSEAQSSQSYDTLRISAQYITPRCAIDILVPFKKIVCKSQSFSVVKKASECLRRIALGIVDNTFITTAEMLMFISGILLEKISALQVETKKRTEVQHVERDVPDTFIIPQAPRTRYGAVTNVLNSENLNMHVFAEFALYILHILLKRRSVTADNFTPLIPLIPLLNDNLKVKHVKVTTLSLNCLPYLLEMNFLPLDKELSNISDSVFSILHKYYTAGLANGDQKDMVVAAFKAVTSIIRKRETLSEDHLKSLLYYVEQDMNDSVRQATAFPLFKAILSKRFVAPEIDSIIFVAAKLSISSEHDHVQQNARQVCMDYIMNYPLGPKIEKIIKFFVAQLSYELEPGRLSALQVVKSMIKTFPASSLKQYLTFLFCSLGAAIVNCGTPKFRQAASEVFKQFVVLHYNESVYEHSFTFLKDARVSHRTLGAQLCGILVEERKEKMEKHLEELLPVIQRELVSNSNTRNAGAFVALPREEPNEEVRANKEKLNDQKLFQMLTLTKKICIHCPTFLKASIWHSTLDNIGEICQSLLAHEHEWIRLEACSVLGHIFQSIDVEILASLASSACSTESSVSRGFVFYDTRNKIRSLVLDLCDQLEPDAIGEKLIEQVVRNLAYLCRVIAAIPENESESSSEGEVANISVSWVIMRMRKIIHKEIIQTPSLFVVREAVFKWLGAFVHILDVEKLRAHIRQLLAPLARELVNESESHRDVLQVVRAVTKVIKAKVGAEEFTEHMSAAELALSAKKAVRRTERAQLIVSRPEVAAKRKIRLQQKKKVQKKRKLDALKGKIPRRRKYGGDDDGPPGKSSKWAIPQVVN